MMPEPFAALLEHIAPALLVIFRIGGLMMFGPLLGSAAIPVRIKVFLSFLLGILTYPLISSTHLEQTPLSLDLLTLGPLVAMELLLGIIIGFVANLPLVAMQTGGLIMGQQMGLGFAQLYNPAIDDEADVIGQMLFMMALAGFLIMGGLEWMLLAVLQSFAHVPLGGFTPDVSLAALASGLLLASLELALRIAAPLLALIFLETVAMGFIAKTVPQLNILSLGFPLRILVGIGAVAFGLVVISDVSIDGVHETFNAIFAWLERVGP